MASFMDNLKEKVKTNPKTIVLAEGYDERHVKAAVILKRDQLAKGVILVGDTAKIAWNRIIPRSAFLLLAFTTEAPPTKIAATARRAICSCAEYVFMVPISCRRMIWPQAAKTVERIMAMILVRFTLIPDTIATCWFMPTALKLCPSFVLKIQVLNRHKRRMQITADRGNFTNFITN